METFHHAAAAALVSCEAALLFSHSWFSLYRVERFKCSPLKVIQSQLVFAVFHSDQPQQTWRLQMTDAALTDWWCNSNVRLLWGAFDVKETSQEYAVVQQNGEKRGRMRRQQKGKGRRGRKENRVQECFFCINRLGGISSTFSSCGFRERI